MVRATTRDARQVHEDLSALAIILSTVPAPLPDKHEGMAANHQPAIKLLGRIRATRPTSSSQHALSSAFTKWVMRRRPVPSADAAAPRMQRFVCHHCLSMPAGVFHQRAVQAARGSSFGSPTQQGEEHDFSDATASTSSAPTNHLFDGWLAPGAVKELADWVRMRGIVSAGAQRLRGREIRLAFAARIAQHPTALPTATIEIAYEAGRAIWSATLRSFQSVALLEALSDYASSRSPCPSDQDGHGELRRRQCGMVSSANTETLCYELADDFFHLRRLHDKRQSAGPRLVSKNVARISLAHNAPAARSTGSRWRWTVPPAPCSRRRPSSTPTRQSDI